MPHMPLLPRSSCPTGTPRPYNLRKSQVSIANHAGKAHKTSQTAPPQYCPKAHKARAAAIAWNVFNKWLAISPSQISCMPNGSCPQAHDEIQANETAPPPEYPSTNHGVGIMPDQPGPCSHTSTTTMAALHPSRARIGTCCAAKVRQPPCLPAQPPWTAAP